jgi:hypothetical protein
MVNSNRNENRNENKNITNTIERWHKLHIIILLNRKFKII